MNRGPAAGVLGDVGNIQASSAHQPTPGTSLGTEESFGTLPLKITASADGKLTTELGQSKEPSKPSPGSKKPQNGVDPSAKPANTSGLPMAHSAKATSQPENLRPEGPYGMVEVGRGWVRGVPTQILPVLVQNPSTSHIERILNYQVLSQW